MTAESFVLSLWGVRYQVKDVNRSLEFYTQKLGFKLDHKRPPAFAQVSSGNLKLILSGPGASGSRPMPDGQAQAPGRTSGGSPKETPARCSNPRSEVGLNRRHEGECVRNVEGDDHRGDRVGAGRVGRRVDGGVEGPRPCHSHRPQWRDGAAQGLWPARR